MCLSSKFGEAGRVTVRLFSLRLFDSVHSRRKAEKLKKAHGGAMSEQDYATVGGVKVHRSDFAYAPEGSEASEWKLPIHHASHVRNALARFNQTELPAEAKAEVHAKIMRAARKFGIDAKEHSRDAGSRDRDSGARTPKPDSQIPIVVLLTGEGTAVGTPTGMAMHRPGAQLREIAVAVPGSWVKGDHSFTIKKEDLADIVRNFEKRKNDMIVIDYEHASEQPEVARGGPIPGAGWIHQLAVSDQRSAISRLKADSCVLTAFVEWTPQSEEMLRTGQYRFFSPAIDWGARDKETGEPQGATLTSGALTNHPFLEELPPIMLSDGTLITSQKAEGGRQKAENQKGAITMADDQDRRDPEEQLGDAGDTETMSEAESAGEGHGLPMLQVHKGRAGTKHEGHHIFSAGGKMLGCMSEKSLGAYAKKHLGAGAEKASEEASNVTRLILSDVAKDGKLNNQRASELASENRITLADYIRAQEAEKLVEGAIQAGKILPKDRAFFFRDALERPAEFAEYAKGAPQAVKLGVYGIGEAESMSPDQEVTALTKKLIEEKKLQYPAALKHVLSENPGLAERYRAAHSSRVNADGTAN
jgi:phage I-like protein